MPEFCCMKVGAKPIDCHAAQFPMTFCQKMEIFLTSPTEGEIQFFGKVIWKIFSIGVVFFQKAKSSSVIALQGQACRWVELIGNFRCVFGKLRVFQKKGDERQSQACIVAPCQSCNQGYRVNRPRFLIALCPEDKADIQSFQSIYQLLTCNFRCSFHPLKLYNKPLNLKVERL